MTLSLKLKNNQYIFTYMRDGDPSHDCIFQFEMQGNEMDLKQLYFGIQYILSTLEKEK